MSDLRANEHAWFRVRLDAHALDLLDDLERRRFLDHAAACAACAAAMKAHADNRPVSYVGGHIPSHLVARWDRASRRLKGLGRTLVRLHLESCAACRQDLEALGFAAVLEVVDELEEEPLPVKRERVTAEPNVIRVVQGSSVSARARWASWILGGTAGVAVGAAAAVLLVLGPLLTREPPIAPAPPSITPMPGSSSGEAAAIGIASRPVVLPAMTRGEPPSETVVRLSGGERFLNLRLPELFLPDSVRVAVTLVGPGGDSLVRTEVRYEALMGDRTLILGRADRQMEHGRYELRLVPLPGGPESRFVLRLK